MAVALFYNLGVELQFKVYVPTNMRNAALVLSEEDLGP